MRRMDIVPALAGYVTVLLLLRWLQGAEFGFLGVVTVSLGYSAVWVLFSALPRGRDTRRR